MSRRAAAPALLLLLAACGGGGAVQQMPVPAMSSAPVTLPPIEPATIAVPVSVSLATLRVAIEKEFPPTDSLDQARCTALGGLVCHQYVYRRDTVDLRMDGDRVAFFTRLRYRGRVALPRVGGLGSCGYDGEPMKRAELHFGTQLYWRNNWTLASRQTALSALLPDPCEVTVLKIDATPLMQRVVDAQLARLTRQVDSALPTLANIRPAADSMWRTMQEPQALDSTNTLWLLMSPSAVSVAPLTGNGAFVNTAVVITARPRVVLGQRPAVVVQPLPALTLARPTEGFRVPVDVEVPFSALSERATAELMAETANTSVRAKRVQIWGVGDTAVVKLDMEGTVNGSLYLTGRFAYDAAARAVRLDDLKYTVQSNDLMSRLKVTLGAPLVRRAVQEATGHGRLDVGAQLDSVRVQLDAQMNRRLAPNATISGAVRDVQIVGVYTTPSSFVVRVVMDGAARLAVQ